MQSEPEMRFGSSWGQVDALFRMEYETRNNYNAQNWRSIYLKDKTMSTLFRSFRNRHLLIAIYFLCALVAMLFLSITASAEDHENSTDKPADSKDSPLSFSQVPVDQSQGAGCCDTGCSQSCRPPRWTVSADVIILNRIGSVNRTLVERVPGTVPPTTPGTQALNSNAFQQGVSAGPRISLIRHGDSGYDLELSYFQIGDWGGARTIGPDNPPDWLVMRAPGGFLQTQDHPYQAMAWDDATKLYNAELNVRWNPCRRVTVLAGFRWIELKENLQGALVPTEGFPPFWNTSTNNNLYGFQIGAGGKILERGRFSIEGVVKAGIYDNNAEQSTGVSIFKIVRPSYASANNAAFVGETGLQCKYQVNKRLVLKAGYEVLWLAGVALAPGQIQETYMIPLDIVQAHGVNCNSGVLYHGATAGLEYSF